MVIIGTELTCRLYDSHSLKDKRRVVKSLMARMMNKYPVSMAEVADQDLHNQARLGTAIVCNDYKHARRVLNEVHRQIERQYNLEIVHIEWYGTI